MRPWINYSLIFILCSAAIFMVLLARGGFYSHLSDTVSLISPTEKASEYASENRLTVYYHERRPYYMTDNNRVVGLCADPIEQVFHKSGIPFQWVKMPAKRQINAIRKNDVAVCAAGWFKTPEREVFSKFTLPVYQDKSFVAIARSNNTLMEGGTTISKIIGERRLKLLVKSGYSYGTVIDNHINKLNPRIVTTTANNEGMLKMIHSHNADYFFLAGEEAQDLLNISEYDKNDFRLFHFNDMPEGNKRYIICSLKTSDAVIDSLNHQIRKTDRH